MYCKQCGTNLKEGAAFCHKCGIKIVNEYVEQNIPDKLEKEKPLVESDYVSRRGDEKINQIERKESLVDENDSDSIEWWDNCSKGKKILIVLGALLAGAVIIYALIAFLREFGYLLFGIAVIGGFFITLKTGTKEEKIEMRKTIMQMMVGVGVIAIIVIVIGFKPELISNIIQPGASVRNAYLSEYSENVTIEEAFNNFFENGKWSTYKEKGYSYVIFNGVCEYLGERADAKIVFKITGENFIVDSLDINGQTQNSLILYSLLTVIYEDY